MWKRQLKKVEKCLEEDKQLQAVKRRIRAQLTQQPIRDI